MYARRNNLKKQREYYYKMKQALHEMKQLEGEYQSLVLENTEELSNYFLKIFN